MFTCTLVDRWISKGWKLPGLRFQTGSSTICTWSTKLIHPTQMVQSKKTKMVLTFFKSPQNDELLSGILWLKLGKIQKCQPRCVEFLMKFTKHVWKIEYISCNPRISLKLPGQSGTFLATSWSIYQHSCKFAEIRQTYAMRTEERTWNIRSILN